jgi:hypothetical protein
MSRSYEYARCAAILSQDPDVDGKEALYDQALTNALVTIVESEWPGEEFRQDGKVKSARQLLQVIENRTPEVQPSTRSLTPRDRTSKVVLINTRALADGLDATQPVRHGRPTGGSALKQEHIDALVELREHPALFDFYGALSDSHWAREMLKDREAIGRAEEYFSFLTEDEQQRRAHPDYVAEYLPFDPKERYAAPDPQECPACNFQTLVVDYLDYFGFGFGAGTCVACGYIRTTFIADELGQSAALEWNVSKPD